MYDGVSIYMTKDNVKHPCSCGSGIEADQCCHSKNVIKMNYDIYNNDLNELHMSLVSYAITYHQDIFLFEAEFDHLPDLEELSEVEQTYLNGITFWSILHLTVHENDKTIFDAFFQQEKEQIKRTRTRDTFETWKEALPSVYKVTSIEQGEKPFATLVDVITGEEFITPVQEDHYTIGNALIGILVPYVGYHHFFLSMIEIYEHGVDKVVELFEAFLSDGRKVEKDFPLFLSMILGIEREMLHWNRKIEEEVADLFSEHLDKKAIPEELKTLGVLVWYEYCLKTSPTIKSANAQAAALEYFLQSTVLEDHTVTQKQIAKEYDTTSGAVSANYRKIKKYIEKEMLLESLLSNHHKVDDTAESGQYTDSFANSATRIEAQEMLYDAQMAHGEKRQRLIKEALSIHPYHADAYLLLAEEAYDDSQFEQLVLQAIQAGEKDLGEAFFREHQGSFWSIPETRPYMRAKEVYTIYLYKQGESEEALEHAEDLLSLNPSDNQGIRYFLLPIYLELEMLEEAEKLINQYDEQSTNFLFNKILLEYISHGSTLTVRRYIKEANQYNPYVKKYLKNIESMPDPSDFEDEYGNEFEAIEYVDNHVDLWYFYPDLLKIL